MNSNGSHTSRFLPLALLVVSGASLLLGLSMPIAIMLDTSPSVMAYGLVLFSFPLWLIGCIFAGITARLLKAKSTVPPLMTGIAWALSAMNALAILICLIWQPAGVS